MQTRLVGALLAGATLFVVLIALVTVLTAMLLGQVPNAAQFTPSSNLAFYRILWQENPWETIRLVLLVDPLLVVEHLDPRTGLQVWGLYFYAGTLLVYGLVSGFTAVHLQRLRRSTAGQHAQFAAGVAALLFSVSYVRRIECCGGGPGWVAETWLRAQVYTPDLGPVNWTLFYERLGPWMPMLQYVVLLSGILLLIRWYSETRPAAFPRNCQGTTA